MRRFLFALLKSYPVLPSRYVADVDLGAFENVEGAAIPISAGAFGNDDDENDEGTTGNDGADSGAGGQNVQEKAISEEHATSAGASAGDAGDGSTHVGNGPVPSSGTAAMSNASESGQLATADAETDAAGPEERRKRKRKAKKRKKQKKTKLKIRCALASALEP